LQRLNHDCLDRDLAFEISEPCFPQRSAALCYLGYCTPRWLALAARGRVPHSAKNPFTSGRDVNQDAIANSCERQTVWLVHPTPDSAWIAAYLMREWVEVGKISE
jgi:hypothetical protein